MALIEVQNPEQIGQLLSRADSLSTWKENEFVFGKQFDPFIRLHFEGPKFDRSMTSSVMRGIVGLQDSLNRLYAIEKPDSTRLTKDEKNRLEMITRVDRGSSIVTIDVSKAFEVFRAMTGTQLLISVGVLVIGYLGGKLIHEYFATRREKIEKEAQRQAKSDDKEVMLKALSVLDDTMSSSRDALRAFAATNANKIGIQGETFTPKELNELTKIPRHRNETVRRVVDGKFMVTRIDLETPEETFVEVVSVDDGLSLPRVSLQSTEISRDDYSMIKEAVERSPLRLRIVVERKGDRILSAYLDSVMKD